MVKLGEDEKQSQSFPPWKKSCSTSNKSRVVVAEEPPSPARVTSLLREYPSLLCHVLAPTANDE